MLFDDSYQPRIGRAETLRAGNDVTLIGTGLMVSRCLEAAGILASEGIQARVLEVHTTQPLDSESVLRAARERGALVTAEEHSTIGGLGSAVAEADACPVPVKRVGIPDRFAESGVYVEILDRYGLSVEDVVSAACEAVAAKRDGS